MPQTASSAGVGSHVTLTITITPLIVLRSFPWLVPSCLHVAHGSARGGRAEDDEKLPFSVPISPFAVSPVWRRLGTSQFFPADFRGKERDCSHKLLWTLFFSVNPKVKDPYRSLLYRLSGKSFFARLKLNFPNWFPVCCLTKFCFVSILRCFKRALEIDGSNSSLWEEVCPVYSRPTFV